MKNKLLKTSLMTAAMAALISASHAANTRVEWVKADEYKDLGTAFHDDATVGMFADELEPYIARIAHDHLPDGYDLHLKVTNVDLAGEYEPWRAANDVRIVRDIYPPSMSFTFELKDTNGKVVASGEETITDLDFTFNIGRRFFDADQFFYEKELISSWIRNDLTTALDS